MLGFLAFGILLGQQTPVQRVTSLTGNIVKTSDFESKFLGNKRNVLVYLPPGYAENPTRRYPVLYCHDGQNVFDGATSYMPNLEWRVDESAEALIKAGLIEPIIIVAVANGGVARSNEYLPWRFRMGNSDAGGKADLYGQFLLEEVKPFVDKSYRTKPGGRDTAMLGSSFGAVITFHLGLKYPGSFSRLGLLSPSVWAYDKAMLKQVQGLPKKLNLRIWIDVGKEEPGDMVKDAEALTEAFKAKGWKSPKELAYYEDGFAGHNEYAWARRVPAILIWMFGKG